ncbi:MAG TPA: hypothetical protein VLH19_03370 [Patescibacteria group bacterium]|nr:hypothetical protein [Patescibacteria group bacterium]
MNVLAGIGLLSLGLYAGIFILLNAVRQLKPYDNELIYNPIRLIAEVIKDLRD